MEILTTPNPKLREKSSKVNKITDETREIVDQMIKANLEWEKKHPYELSAAMAAPQMGFMKRIVVIRDDLDDKKNTSYTALIDPEVIKTEGKFKKDYEGCLSVPKIYCLFTRPHKARIKAKLIDGTEVRIKTEGGLTRTLLHEIDHLDGKLFIDYIKDDADAWFELNQKGDIVPIDYEKQIKNNKDLFPDED